MCSGQREYSPKFMTFSIKSGLSSLELVACFCWWHRTCSEMWKDWVWSWWFTGRHTCLWKGIERTKTSATLILKSFFFSSQLCPLIVWHFWTAILSTVSWSLKVARANTHFLPFCLSSKNSYGFNLAILLKAASQLTFLCIFFNTNNTIFLHLDGH